MNDPNETHELVKKAYGDIARNQSACCSSKAASCGNNKAYVVPDHPVPESELGLSCGNPLAFGYINKGDVVLDLGSGAGKDVFLAAQKVGETGKAIGVDMTADMLKLARRNAVTFFETTGLANVEFIEGQIERLPLPDASVDVVISNCVINLSPDKPQVFREVARVLTPQGRMIVSDIVVNRRLPQSLLDSASLYAACIAGALLREDYLEAIRAAGFKTIQVLSDQPYKASFAGDDPVTGQIGTMLEGAAASLTVLARK